MDLLPRCPPTFKHLYGLSCFGSMGVNRRTTASSPYTDEDVEDVEDTLVADYLEGAWETDITMYEGWDKLNEIYRKIHADLRDIIRETEWAIEWEKQQKEEDDVHS